MRDVSSTSLGYALGLGAATGAVYFVLFVGIAIGRSDRNRYAGKLRSIAGLPALRAA